MRMCNVMVVDADDPLKQLGQYAIPSTVVGDAAELLALDWHTGLDDVVRGSDESPH